MYIFLASLLPALAFGEQIDHATDGLLTGVQVVLATAIGGLLQAIIGGQPLLIVGVAEPILLVYTYMYSFAKDKVCPRMSICVRSFAPVGVCSGTHVKLCVCVCQTMYAALVCVQQKADN